MIKTISGFLMVVTLTILSCSKGEEAKPTYDFNVTVEPGYFAFEKDAWIILHDKGGKAIGESQLLEGETSKFTVSDKNIGVTIVGVVPNTLNNVPTFQLETFLNVNSAAAWTLKRDNFTPLNCSLELGSVEIIVSDADISSSLSGSFGTKGSLQLPDGATSTATSIHFLPLPIYAGCNSAFLYILDKARVPHYKMLENVNPGQYAYTIPQLDNFDKVIDINYKVTTSAILAVTGFAADQSVYGSGYSTNFNFGDYMNNVSSSLIKVGYLNRFPKYRTTFSLSYPGYFMYYLEAGGVPSAITMPETLMATISDKTLAGYAFSVNEEIVYRQVTFDYYPLSSTGESSMSWTINSGPESDFKNLTAAPTQFITKYPQFKTENLKHNASYFYKENQTIYEIVSQRFSGAARPETYKSVYKAFNN
jgi:hypothetical protein